MLFSKLIETTLQTAMQRFLIVGFGIFLLINGMFIKSSVECFVSVWCLLINNESSIFNEGSNL